MSVWSRRGSRLAGREPRGRDILFSEGVQRKSRQLCTTFMASDAGCQHRKGHGNFNGKPVQDCNWGRACREYGGESRRHGDTAGKPEVRWDERDRGTDSGYFFAISKAFDDLPCAYPAGRSMSCFASGSISALRAAGRYESNQRSPRPLAQTIGGSRSIPRHKTQPQIYNKLQHCFPANAVVTLLMAMIIVLSISDTMTMNASERIGEIGIAMALGTHRRESWCNVLEGGPSGSWRDRRGHRWSPRCALLWILGIPMPLPPGDPGLFRRDDGRRPIITSSIVLAVMAALLATLYPAWKASRLQM